MCIPASFVCALVCVPYCFRFRFRLLHVPVCEPPTYHRYYGARSSEDMAYMGKFTGWEALGVQVVPVLSKPSESWGGAKGYVQSALRERGIPKPGNTMALLCGMKDMAEDVS